MDNHMGHWLSARAGYNKHLDGYNVTRSGPEPGNKSPMLAYQGWLQSGGLRRPQKEACTLAGAAEHQTYMPQYATEGIGKEQQLLLTTVEQKITSEPPARSSLQRTRQGGGERLICHVVGELTK